MKGIFRGRGSRTLRIRQRGPADTAVTIAHVPIYEFECGRCGARFEELVGTGTEPTRCCACEADGTGRVDSPPAPEPQLVKSGAAAREQDARNAELRARTKGRFVNARERARRRRRGSR
jgi:putative FmdB family regulatory protein